MTTHTETATPLNPNPAIPHAELHGSPNQDILAELQEQGYTILRSHLPESLLTSLRTASAHLTHLARAGQWPYVRLHPKEFPPWPTTQQPSSDSSEVPIWGVQHLLHPRLPSRTAFAALYFSPELLTPIRTLLSLPPSEDPGAGLVMELFNMLVDPPSDFTLRWHRDGLPLSDLSLADEATHLKLPNPHSPPAATHAQYNIPLYADASLEVVPRSHRRTRSAEEKGVLDADIFAEELPGAVTVRLKPGDVVFYDSDLIHRGRYVAGQRRATLHGSVGAVPSTKDEAGEVGRARNVLQHGVGSWAGTDEGSFTKCLDERRAVVAEGMRARLVEMGEGWKGDAVFKD